MSIAKLHQAKRIGAIVGKFFPIILFVISLGFSWFTVYHCSTTLLDGDTSSMMVLSDLLATENTLLTTDWDYGNEIAVMQKTLVFFILFKLFSDWSLIRVLGTIIMQILFVLSYLFLARQMKMKRNGFFYSASVLVLPFSIIYGRFVLLHTYYIWYLLFGFLLVGLYLSLLDQIAYKRKLAPILLRGAALALLAFGTGLNGIRQLMTTMAPMLLAALMDWWRTKRTVAAAEKAVFIKKRQAVLLAVGVCVCCFAGFLINSKIFARLYTFGVFTNMVIGVLSPDALRWMSMGWLKVFGFQELREILSVEGVLSICGLFAAIYMTVQGVSILKSKDSDPNHTGYIRWLFLASVALMTIIFIFMYGFTSYQGYYLTVAIWFVPILGSLIDKWQEKDLKKKPDESVTKGFLVLTCVILFVNGYFNNAFFIDPSGKQVEYDGLNYYKTNVVEELKGAADFLVENEFTFGYTTYWYSHVLTEYTDGKLKTAPIAIVDLEDVYIVYHEPLSVKHYRDVEFVEEQQVFLMLTGKEDAIFSRTELAGYGILLYEDKHYTIYTFDSPTLIMEYLAEYTKEYYGYEI